MDQFSFLNAAHASFFDDLYEQYLVNPDSIEPSWRAFFQGFDFGSSTFPQNGHSLNVNADTAAVSEIPEKVRKEFQVLQLIDAYRTRGHLFTRTNPVRQRRQYAPTLDKENFGLTEKDLTVVFNAGEVLGMGASSLFDIIEHLERIYCASIGIEYMYIRKPQQIVWIQNWLNKNDNQPAFSADEKKIILKRLNEAVSFETFLHTKYVGQKRFSLEGNETLIPSLNSLIERGAEAGVTQFVMGMAHRGRLNVLANIFGKPVSDIFNEFEGKDYEQELFDGDVKYHLGWTSERKTENGYEINMNIAPNPSHLEAVGAIVQGITRAKQDRHTPDDFSKILPIIVHGDAAIAGQGIVYELVQMAQLDGYGTAGTIHIVVNNQLGFTTNYLDGRSSTYCTDVGKATLSPILHVNADDAEAVVHASKFVLDFRMTYKRDVFLDLLGYRKYGHNEGDEPRFTQPRLYKAIATHANPREIYAEKLIAEGVIDEAFVHEIEEKVKIILDEQLEDSKKQTKAVITSFMQDEWKGFDQVDENVMMKPVNTKYPGTKLKKITEALSTLPKDKKFIRKIEKIVESRMKMFKDDKLDWSMGEHLAYGSLLLEGFNVRFSGQDSERGTFSHRHAVLKIEDSEEEIILHNNLAKTQGKFEIFNSLLSEYAVMGFDYGYSMACPQTLTIWEAQFGDFCNGAQIIIDQYISAAEDKWKMQNGLTLFLPHGYEGQGAEHSSARMERFLQLCATDNMFVANCSTPANLFHILRRQMHANYRKPLILFTPKSLLRLPQAVSTLKEFTEGNFQMVIDTDNETPGKIKSLVFCSGKLYYDLLEYRKENKRKDVALVRIEQLFPFPAEEVEKVSARYKKAEIVWAQEEPLNMGAWTFLILHYEPCRKWRVCSRRLNAAPASGSSIRAKERQIRVIDSVFNKTQKT